MAVFLVSGVICRVASFNDQDLNLPNHVKYKSYLIFFSERPLTNTPITITISFFIFQTCQLTIT